ncbi:MAG: hypothetical protein DDG58_04740 [Ardenticatenia bacterium]|nr:MAG: hypothetical protein DDG58_04740 [Ardenticatenia bacterium]
MTQPPTVRLSWNKAIVLVTLVFLVGASVTAFLLSQALYLLPPLTNGTPAFYLALVLVPTILMLIRCARMHPSGLRISGVLLPVWIAVLTCFYLALLGPALFRYSAIECHSATRSGLLIHHACTCRVETYEGRAQRDCSLDGFAWSPMLPLTAQK